MTKSKRVLIIPVILIMGLLSGIVACDSTEKTINGTPVGPYKDKLAPDFTLNSLDGDPVTLSQLRGKPVLLIFWATWCSQCRIELDYWKTAYDDYADQNLEILAVNVGESESQVSDFAEEKGLNIKVLLDSDSDVSDSYLGGRGIPRNFFIDGDGFIRAVVIGRYEDEAQWDIQLQKIFQQE